MFSVAIDKINKAVENKTIFTNQVIFSNSDYISK